MSGFRYTISFHNDNPNTVWNRLAAKLGRQPTTEEAIEEVKRLLREDHRERQERGTT